MLSWGTWRNIVLTVVTALLMFARIFLCARLFPLKRASVPREVHSEIPGAVQNPPLHGFSLTMCFAFGAMFSYISGSTFVLQNILGLKAGQFTLAFGVNSSALWR